MFQSPQPGLQEIQISLKNKKSTPDSFVVTEKNADRPADEQTTEFQLTRSCVGQTMAMAKSVPLVNSRWCHRTVVCKLATLCKMFSREVCGYWSVIFCCVFCRNTIIDQRSKYCNQQYWLWCKDTVFPILHLYLILYLPLNYIMCPH